MKELLVKFIICFLISLLSYLESRACSTIFNLPDRNKLTQQA